MEVILRNVVVAILLSLGLIYGAVYYGMCQRQHVPNRHREGESTAYELKSMYTVPVAITVAVSATLMAMPLLNVLDHPFGAATGVVLGYGAWRSLSLTDHHREPTARLILRYLVILVAWIAIDVSLGGQPHVTQVSAWTVGLANVPALVVLSLHARGVHESRLIGDMRTARLALRVVAGVALLTMHPWARQLCTHGCTPTFDWVFGHKSTYVIWVLSSSIIVATSTFLWYDKHRRSQSSSQSRNRKGA